MAFLLFVGEHYYPLGGWGDFVAPFETREAAIAAAKIATANNEVRWAQVVDLNTMTKIHDE